MLLAFAENDVYTQRFVRSYGIYSNLKPLLEAINKTLWTWIQEQSFPTKLPFLYW